MKCYTIEIFLEEGSDEFWEDATKDGKTGADEVLEAMKDIIVGAGWDAELRLTRFTDSSI